MILFFFKSIKLCSDLRPETYLRHNLMIEVIGVFGIGGPIGLWRTDHPPASPQFCAVPFIVPDTRCQSVKPPPGPQITDMPSFKLEPLTLEDCPAITDLWFAAFSGDPHVRRVFPDTPAIRQWLTDANRHDMSNKPFQRYVKVIDTATSHEQGRPRIAAYAKWDTSMPDERGSRYPPWHEEMPASLCDEFFAKEEENRIRIMGGRRHFCKFSSVCRVDSHSMADC